MTLIVPAELSVIILIILLILKLIHMEVTYLKNNEKSTGCSDAGNVTLGYEKSMAQLWYRYATRGETPLNPHQIYFIN